MEAQKAFVIKQGKDGKPIAEVYREAGISQATHFNWRKKYSRLMPWEVPRLKLLEAESSCLKRMMADLSLDKAMLQDVLVKKMYGPPGRCKGYMW